MGSSLNDGVEVPRIEAGGEADRQGIIPGRTAGPFGIWRLQRALRIGPLRH